MNKTIKKKLFLKSLHIKKNILKICYEYGGHVATSFSSTEILVYLYYLKIIFNNKNKSNYLVVSKGHCSELVYSILQDLNFFPKIWFEKHYAKNKFILGQHIDSKIPGVNFSSGSLGHGLPHAVGVAHGLKIKNSLKKVFVLVGDAELCEGSNWEALLIAKKLNLSNLIILIDKNNIGSLDYLKFTSSLDPLEDKIKAFGFDTHIVSNGNCFNSIDKTFLKLNSKKPKVLILKTIKGFGLKEFENDPVWHVKKITKEVYENSIIKLDNQICKI